MSKNCLTCKHCWDGDYCSLFDELTEKNGSCYMWAEEQ